MNKQQNNFPEPNAWLICAVILYLLSFLFIHTSSVTNTVSQESKKLESYIHQQQKDLEKILKDTSLLKDLAFRNASEKEFKKITSLTTGIFIFRKNQFSHFDLLFWGTQNSYPAHEVMRSADGEYMRKQDNGFYLSVKKSFNTAHPGDTLVVIGMIPVQYEYFVENDKLRNDFLYSSSASSMIAISGLPTKDPITSLGGKTILYITPMIRNLSKGSTGFGGLLRIMAAVLLLFFIHFKSESISRKKGFWYGFIFLVVSLLIVRLVSYNLNFPLNLRQFELFNPQVYGSNPVQKSLGDLLINAIFFCWVVLFVSRKFDYKTDYKFLNKGRYIFGSILLIILIVLFTFMMAYTIRSLAADSSISFDVINFFTLTTFTAVGFLTLAIMAVGYYYFMRIMIPLISSFFPNNPYIVYLVMATAGLTVLTFEIDNPLLRFYMIILGWLLFYTWLLQLKRFAINKQRQSMAGALFWIFVFSVSITFIIIGANRQKEWEQRKQYALKLDIKSDPDNETELNISLVYFDDEFLTSNFYRFKDPVLGRYFRDSILRRSPYLSKYDSRLFVFDEKKEPVNNDEEEQYNNIELLLRTRSSPSEVDTAHLFYYETEEFGKYAYLFRKRVKDEDGELIGTIFILSDPEHYSSEALVPELFKNANQSLFEETERYSYGIYKGGILITSPHNKYSFSTNLNPKEIPVGRFNRISRGGFDELWYKASNDKVIVIVRNKNTLLEAITLFSYIFCVFLFLVAIFNLLVLILRVSVNVKQLRQLMQWNIRTQVHSTIILVSIFSFIVIGIATISFFIRRYSQNNEEKLSRTMEIVVKELKKNLEERRAMDDQLPFYDSVSNAEVVKLVNEVSEIHSVDVNVYDTMGKLHVTSQAIVYQEGYISERIHPVAFYHLNQLRQVQYFQEEKLSTLSYLSVYAPLRGNDGIAYAYINIPYFLSQSGLKQEISNFIVAIINLNAFIFLIAGVIALFITNRVTRSFSLISEKMKEVNLGKTNEEIDWNRDDEIGGLVREYNKMVKKLEVSAVALAKSEREGAWREMARQVAHEIKNPLTPMKLSIQYLQKSIDNNSANVKELTANVAKTLVEQIDHLSKIAFDFSQFANIGNTFIETFDINNVIQSLESLYKTNTNVNLILDIPDEKYLVKADKTQMNRLFTNLIQNAIEACDGNDVCKIELTEKRENGQVIISIKDNGAGIPEDMQSKIFIPNFTTKTSGTGLGLAMCKGIVEQANGKIWFKTKKGEGSIFSVELPLVN